MSQHTWMAISVQKTAKKTFCSVPGAMRRGRVFRGRVQTLEWLPTDILIGCPCRTKLGRIEVGWRWRYRLAMNSCSDACFLAVRLNSSLCLFLLFKSVFWKGAGLLMQLDN